MAGIGFELKKLFNKKGLLNAIKAYLYSTLVTIGPFILCTIMITSIQIVIQYLDIDFIERELFLATVVYAFIFSQIVTSGFSMIITRFVADKLYKEEFEDILPSLYGVMTICIIIGGVIGITFLKNIKLHWSLGLVSYLLYIQLIIMWLQTVYLTALKDFVKIFKAYTWGIIICITLSYILLVNQIFKPTMGLLISLDIGIFFIITILMIYIKSFFKNSNNTYYLFLNYFDKYPELFFTNLFYTLSIYVHNFIFWGSELRVTIFETYVYAPIYDVPTFYAFLSIMPSMVIFVVSIETSFYKKYRKYYSLVTSKGNLLEIENAKKDMVRVLWSEIRNMMELQLFFSLVAIILGNIFLPRLGLIHLSIDIFNTLVIGAFVNVIMLIIILLLLYFEDRKGAFVISFIALTSNIYFTTLTVKLGSNFYGMGFFISAFISTIIALIRLNYYLKNLNYFTFCSRPIIYKEPKGIFTWIVKRIYNK